jgi:hypothetical protein
MPLRHIDGTNLDYYLVLFDGDGNERREQDGSLLSETLTEAVRDGVTDVFLASHGWMGDIPAAIKQYDSWIAAMAAQSGDQERARALDPDFKALIVGVHWPSKPWGTENVGAALLGDAAGDELGDDTSDEFAVERRTDPATLVDRYAKRIADTPAARTALAAILDAADDDQVLDQVANRKLPADLESAYQTLFSEAGLDLGGATAAPGSDQQAFSPLRIMTEWTSAAAIQGQQDAGEQPGAGTQPAARQSGAGGVPGLLDGAEDQPGPLDGAEGQPGLLGGGIRQNLKDALLGPVRQLSFWAMKHRARTVGETGVHSLLIDLQQSAPDARFHLMGHSFGCIVVSATVAGPLDNGTVTSRLPRPVHSLFLAQGALSLWSFADSIPYPPRVPGYFRPIGVPPALVQGPIVTTRSAFDHAVGTFFPLGATLGDERVLDDQPPEFGGVGAFGIRGTATHDMKVLNASANYGFEAGHIYNIDASTVICHGKWPSGAHSDIAHPPIAHLFWQAALSGIAS